MSSLWFQGDRDQMLDVFGDIETAGRYYRANAASLRGNGSRPMNGWWECFGPHELRSSHPDNPDLTWIVGEHVFTGPRTHAELHELRGAWLDANPEAEW